MADEERQEEIRPQEAGDEVEEEKEDEPGPS